MIPSHFDVRAPGLRAAREARGLTRTGLGLLAATPPTTIALLEEGIQAATEDELRVRLLRALDATFHEVFQVVTMDRFGRISAD